MYQKPTGENLELHAKSKENLHGSSYVSQIFDSKYSETTPRTKTLLRIHVSGQKVANPSPWDEIKENYPKIEMLQKNVLWFPVKPFEGHIEVDAHIEIVVIVQSWAFSVFWPYVGTMKSFWCGIRTGFLLQVSRSFFNLSEPSSQLLNLSVLRLTCS